MTMDVAHYIRKITGEYFWNELNSKPDVLIYRRAI